MASLTDVQLFTSLVSDATRGAIRVTFQNASQAKAAGGNIHHLSACAPDPEYIPEHSKMDTNMKLRCFFQVSPHQYKSLLWSTKSQRYQREKKSLVVPI